MLTRFAPSPTGFLHLGNIRTALINYLYSKSNQGQFILRIDDTDDSRSKEEFCVSIQEDLSWLGIKWDQFFRQSERLNRYFEVLQILINLDKVYPCYESVEELEIKRKMLLKRGLPPVYDRASLNLTVAQKKEYEAQGIKPYFRFKLDHSEVKWEDKLKGLVSISLNSVSDPILLRGNNFFTYILPSTIDDIDYNITHIVRGEDHITNTAIQIQIIKTLNKSLPEFMHLPLVKIGASKISKRNQDQYSIKELRAQHYEPLAINSYLAKIGTSESFEPFYNMEDLIKTFNCSSFSSSNPQFDENILKTLNAKIIQNLPFSYIKEKVHIPEFNENFWNSIKSNITTLEEIATWWKICKTSITPIIEDIPLIKIASECLPEGEFNETSFKEWVNNIKARSKKTGAALFMPIRLALTASEEGPELAKLLPLIGKTNVISRLKSYSNAKS